MNLLAVLAFVAFVIAAVLAFLVETVGNTILIGIVSTGLALWIASSIFPAPRT